MGFEFEPHAVGESIWGVEDDRSNPASPAPQPAPDVGPDQLGPGAEAEALDVAERRPGVSIDEHRAGGAARERLDPEGTGAAVEVEDGGADDDPLAQRREDRLADAVGGRAHLPATRRDQAPAAKLSGDHPHRPG